jgi:hypothetical protein
MTSSNVARFAVRTQRKNSSTANTAVHPLSADVKSSRIHQLRLKGGVSQELNTCFTVVKMGAKKLARRFRKSFLVAVTIFAILYCIIITTYDNSMTDAYNRAFDEINHTENIARVEDDTLFQPPPYNWSNPGQVKPFEHTENVPLRHVGYMRQNGPLMIKRTLERSQDRIAIVFDTSLRKEFRHFKQCMADCQFSFSSNYDEIAGYADSFVTDKHKGM